MTESLAADVSPADTARAAVRRVALWWRGLVGMFALAAVIVAAMLGFAIPTLESRLTAIGDAARERAVIEESADLAARLAESVTAEQRQATRQFLIGQIAILDRIAADHADGKGALLRHREAWQAPDGAFYRYVQALRAMVGESTGLPPLPPTPDEAFAVIDQSLVLQNQRARTLMMMMVAGAGGVLAMTVVAGLLSLPAGLRPARAAFRAALRSSRAGGRLPSVPPRAGGTGPVEIPVEIPMEIMAQALDQCRPMVLITSSTGTIEYANASFLAHNGYTASEVIGQPVRILSAGVTPRGTYRTAWETLLDGKAWSGEFCNRRRDGSCYWAQTTITPVRDNTRRVVRFIAIEQDAAQSADAPFPPPRHTGGAACNGTALRNGAALL